MRKTRTTKLNLLSLENRLTPNASISFVSGNLTVTGDNVSNTIVVTGHTGKMSVYVAAGDQVGSYPANLFTTIITPANLRMGNINVTGNVTVNGGNSADFIMVNVDDGTSYPGNVAVNAGNGNDDVIIQSYNTIGTIPGSITMNGGLGADNLSIIGIDGQGLVNVNGGGGGLRPGVGGKPAPGDVFRLFASNIGNSVIVRDAITGLDDTFPYSGTTGLTVNPAGGNTIQGNLIVSNPTVSPLGGFIIDGVIYPAGFVNTFPAPQTTGYSGLLVIDTKSMVTGNVVYTGSTSNDGVYNLGTVNGGLTFADTTGGNNDFVLGNGTAPATVAGQVTFVGGSGIDHVGFLAGATVINGGASLYMGDGNNTFDLNHSFFVGGGFNLTAGNGDDNIGTVSGFINGNQSYSPGNGANTLCWMGMSGSSRFDYNGGGGQDKLMINGSNGFQLYVSLGAGDDSFGYGAFASVASAQIDGGAGFDDYYQDPTVNVGWNQTQSGFETSAFFTCP